MSDRGKSRSKIIILFSGISADTPQVSYIKVGLEEMHIRRHSFDIFVECFAGQWSDNVAAMLPKWITGNKEGQRKLGLRPA